MAVDYVLEELMGKLGECSLDMAAARNPVTIGRCKGCVSVHMRAVISEE